jgi:small conductance mechanosensitive channel
MVECMETVTIATIPQQLTHWLLQHQQVLLYSLFKLLIALLIFWIGRWLARVCSRGVSALLQRQSVDDTIIGFVRVVIQALVLLIGIIAALGAIGVQTGSLLAVLGTVGLAVALALRDSLANFAAGILLVLFRPFRVGETIELAGVTGTVQHIHLFSTVLNSADHKLLVVPNGTIVKGTITNYSRQPQRRVDFLIGVAYSADIDQTKRLLTELIAADSRVLLSLGITVRLKELGASSLDFTVRCWVNNADYWPVYFDLLEAIKKQLDAHNIAIPFPQMDVHLHSSGSQR